MTYPLRPLAVLALLAGPAAAQDAKIGVIAPLTGPVANTGEALRQGMELAVKEWNEGQGDYVTDDPPEVEVLIEDSNSKPEVAISAAQRLVASEGIDLLIGDALHSHLTLALMEFAPQYDLPMLSAEPVSSAIAEKVMEDPERYALYWKGNYNSDGYGIAVHDFHDWAFENGVLDPGAKRIAFVVEDTDYGLSNAEKIGELFEEDGWEVVATETVAANQTDFFPQLSKLRDLEPDVTVSVFTVVNSGAAFVRQMDEQALETQHLGIYYPTKPEFLDQAADVAEGMIWAALQFSPDITPEHGAFSDKVEAEYGVPATYSHAHGYCTMVIALRALDAAGGTGAEAVGREIGDTEYDCIIGRFDFGEDHAVQSGEGFLPVPVAQVQDGAYQVIWPESVATAEPR